MISISEAIKTINSEAEFTYKDEDISTIEWLNNTTPISKDNIQLKIIELENEYNSKQYQTKLENDYTVKQYQRNRAEEYPDFKEYLDGIVKSDQAQIDKYIADCQAVKLKYPKGSV